LKKLFWEKNCNLSQIYHIMYCIAAAFLLFNVFADDFLVTFDGASGTTFNFEEMNDPVMGGQSTGTWTVNTDEGFGIMDGEVVNVPSLSAPGFIKSAADGTFKDVSADIGGYLVLSVRSTTPEYTGFRVTMAAGTYSPAYACAGGSSIPFSGGCYKAKFSVPSGNEFQDVRIPLMQFSDHWSPATGEHTKECSYDSSVCITADELKAILRMELWAEGSNGKVHLEVKSIRVTPKTERVNQPITQSGVRPSPEFDVCESGVQDLLNFGISGRLCYVGCEKPEMPLAESVCCDSRNQAGAEPQFLFEAPDINFFGRLDSTKVTIFYDSVCGVPLFKAPVSRSFDVWKAETEEHGWPSFRTPEIYAEHVIVNKTTGYVTSSCGTHLGTYLPDVGGAPRYCIDLSCMAGNADSVKFFQ